MSTQYTVILEGLDDLPDFGEITPKITTAARQAVNRALDRARTMAAREIRTQVRFPASYLTGPDARLRVTKRASNNNLEGVITGRHRPTSLARFTKDTNPKAVRRRGGVRVNIKPDGGAKFLRGSWLIRLRAGKALTDTQFNLGLAIRLRPGESLHGSRGAVRLSDNVYLLYGPSVSQVFRTVRGDISPEVLEFLETEFDRLVQLRGL